MERTKPQRFEGGGDAGDRLRVVVGVVEAACVDVEEAVAGFGGEANAVEVSALLNQAIAQGVSAFGFPLDDSSGIGVFGPNVVKPMGKEGKELVIPLTNVLKTSFTRFSHAGFWLFQLPAASAHSLGFTQRGTIPYRFL